jgi:hypothetical protein
MTRRPGKPPQQQAQAGTPPPALARKPSDEQPFVQNIRFCPATERVQAGAEFVHIGYLESSLSLPRLTRRSAALTCS